MKKSLKQLVKLAMAACRAQCLVGGALQVRMDVSLYQLSESLSSVTGELREVKMQIAQKAGDPAVKMEELRMLKERGEQLAERAAMLETQIREMKSEATERLKQNGSTSATMSKEEAKGRFYAAVLKGDNVNELPRMVYEQLGAIPAGHEDQGTGSNLLPKEMAREIITDPKIENPLFDGDNSSDIPGLEIPRLSFAVDDDDFIAKDGETAKELKLKGDKLSFGNHKMMLLARVSESVLRSSYVNVARAVEDGLKSSQAAKELKVIFATSPKSGEEGMSLYSAKNKVKEVEGANLFDAILNAYGDLEDIFVPNASVVMRRQDYIGMIKALSNNSTNLFDKKPEQILGIPVMFSSYATQPVVGDFRYLHRNFNAQPLYDTDKDVSTGNRLFVLTHWYDIQVKLASAFRRAKVQPGG